MIRLHESKMLETLHQSLSQCIPKAMKVYGSIFNIIRGNPFNLEVLVDSWPDYQTVITRPQKQMASSPIYVEYVTVYPRYNICVQNQAVLLLHRENWIQKEMMDDKDHYTNTYHIFSKDFQKLPAILECDSVINWKQSLTIQGCQNGLNKKIQDVVAFKSVKVDYSKRFLYMTEDVFKSIASHASKLMKPNEVTSSENVTFRRTNNNFKLSLLDVSHAELVNNNWKYGQNEKSLRFIKRCLQNFPGFCLLGPEGNPISWTIIEHTNEVRMGYTLPEYRGRRITQWMGIGCMQYLKENDMPFYCHVEEMNENSHKLMKSLGFQLLDSGWHEWKCVPVEF